KRDEPFLFSNATLFSNAMERVMSNLTGTGKAGLAAFGCLLLVGTFLGLSLILAKLADQAGAPRLTFLMVGIGG
ncbi:MAG TPA: hypothetical protein DCX68_07920, partial [Marinobacter hydrocarbonoclasticus]|nr:hypothetical protein [Marinobacter nauticus]